MRDGRGKGGKGKGGRGKGERGKGGRGTGVIQKAINTQYVSSYKAAG